MKLRSLYLIHSLVVFIYALGLLLIPPTILQLYGFGVSPGEKLLAQFFGVQLLTAGLVTLLARDVIETTARNAINISIVISYAIGLIISIGGTLSNTMNAIGWSAVVIYAAFAIAFAFFQFFVVEE